MKTQTPIRAAMVFAAGYGSRLAPLTDERPKPLIEVLGKPLVWFALKQLETAGVRHVVLNTHHLGAQLSAVLGETFGDMALTFLHEDPILGTGGGLKNAEALLKTHGEGRFWLLNADALVDLDVPGLLAAQPGAGQLSTMLLKTVPDAKAFGTIGTDAEGRVLDFAGRVPVRGTVVQERMFCGVHLLTDAIFDPLPAGEMTCINRAGYPPLLEQGADVRGVEQRGLFWDVGTPARLMEANMDLLTGAAAFGALDVFAGMQARAPGVWVHPGADVAADAVVTGPAWIDRGAVVAAGARVGPRAVLGPNTTVGAGARVSDAVLQSTACIAPDAHVAQCIVGREVRVDVPLV